MRVYLSRFRVVLFVLCSFAGVIMGAALPGAPRLTAIIPNAASANASILTAQPNAEPRAEVLSCPPDFISGVIGAGSPDFPFVTGTQTSRIFRNSVESDCGTPKPSPGLTDDGIQFKFDAYTFVNSSTLGVCITVTTTAGSPNQILTAAYRNSFNPSDVLSNYLGDAGNSDQTRSFSFNVPAHNAFVIVQSRVNNAGSPPSLAYSFRVLGIPGCDSCPPTGISGTIGSAQSSYPKSSATMTGRIFRDAVASTCAAPKPVPSIEDPTVQFAYDAFTFLNASVLSKCVTVTTTAGANYQILTVAYLDRFNPFDVQENYLADAGNSNQSRTFSFTVPGHRSFVVVQGRVNTASNPPSLSYNFGVSGLANCTCNVVLNKSSESFPDIGGQGSFNVSVPSGCDWSADNFNPSFVTITGGSGNGSGNGTVTYSVALNPDTSRRVGVIAVGGQTYTIVQGRRFADVPLQSPFYVEIGKLSGRNITVGCDAGNFCPRDPVLREQMAAFVIRALGDFSPATPPTQRFLDVPPTSAFFGFIDEMAAREITQGCGDGNYCPSAPVLREQMAAFILRALGEPDPPTPTSQRFTDVPPSNVFYKFIDRMAVLGITQGCTSAQYCPAAAVTREQMAAFLVRAFDL